MTHIALNNKILERYFRFLTKFDSKTKMKLISLLSEDLKTELESPEDKESISNLFGAWKDNRESDDIIKNIINSRVLNI